MANKVIYSCIVFCFLISCQAKTQDVVYVNDRIDLLTEEQETELTSQIRNVQETTGSQMVILIIDSLGGEKIEDYSLRTARAWKIGRKDYNDGLLITVAFKDRQIRIEVGSGLERIITDDLARDIISEKIAPSFRQENYYDGLYSAVRELSTLIEANVERLGR